MKKVWNWFLLPCGIFRSTLWLLRKWKDPVDKVETLWRLDFSTCRCSNQIAPFHTFFWMNILDFVLNEYFFEWIFWILFWIEFWIESFLGQIQWKNEFSKCIEQGYPAAIEDLSCKSGWAAGSPFEYASLRLGWAALKVYANLNFTSS